MIIASYLHYSGLESISKVCQIFEQIFTENFKVYKTFYNTLTWNRYWWDTTVNDYFDLVLKELFAKSSYQKVFRLKLLMSRFLRSLTPQSVLSHVCFCSKSFKRFQNCCVCATVKFYDSEMYYYEHFHVGLSKIEVRTVKNLYRENIFTIFSKAPNRFRTIYKAPTFYFTNSDQLMNEFA